MILAIPPNRQDIKPNEGFPAATKNNCVKICKNNIVKNRLRDTK